MVVRKANINNPFTLGQRDWVSADLQKKRKQYDNSSPKIQFIEKSCIVMPLGAIFLIIINKVII
jgi:hypothetical protein